MSGLQDAGLLALFCGVAIRSAIKTSVASSWHFISTYDNGTLYGVLWTCVCVGEYSGLLCL